MQFNTRPAADHAPRVRTPIHELALVAIIEDEPKPAADEAFGRCGWFESSFELASGLQVVEFIDRLPDDLPFETLT